MNDHQTPRALSHDEKQAAEAAFAGLPFNPKWSARARTVYEGIVKLLPAPVVLEEEGLREPTSQASELATSPPLGQAGQSNTEPNKQSVPAKIPLSQAIETGALIDVTSTAKELGLLFPVTVTKPLWDVSIAPTKTMTQDEQSARLRDVLMAFRLRLATQPSISPLIDFPALLAFPPGTVPQTIPLFALIQPDEEQKAMVTLLLPNEVAATIIPMT
jgi:uncharacterized protein DUF6573